MNTFANEIIYEKMKVLITGGSGLIGMALTKKLLANNIEVTHLTRSRNSKAGIKTYEWDWKEATIDQNALKGVTHIVHLAGAGIADKPWSMNRKRVIVKSRVLTARLLFQEVENQGTQLEAFISASGIGYYGAITDSRILKEEDAVGTDFVAECTRQWEREVSKFGSITRTVKLRTGIVLAKGEGAVAKIGSSIRRGIGGPIGGGNQYMPWVHIDDITNMYYESLFETKYNGVYNAVASEHVTNKEFVYALAEAMGKKIRLKNIPSWLIRAVFGEMSEIVLNGSRIDNEKIVSQGYKFEFENIQNAFNDLYKD